MQEKVQITVRPIEDADYNFIIASWLKNYKHSSYFCKRIRDNIYYKYHHSVVSGILARPTTKVLIAADSVDPSVILGYFVTEKFEDKNVIHYAYVKGAFRRLGIGKELLLCSDVNPNESYFSHWTTEVDELIKKFPGMTYVPYLV